MAATTSSNNSPMRRSRLVVLTIGLCMLFACKTPPPPPPPPPPPLPAPPPPPPPPAPRPIEKITISDRIEFESSSDKLLAQSFPALDQVAKILIDKPHIQLIEIHGHTDFRGDHKSNMDLSLRRSASVRLYLISKGIDGARLIARGFGRTMPIDNNATPQGRDRNRRVEFRVIKQAP